MYLVMIYEWYIVLVYYGVEILEIERGYVVWGDLFYYLGVRIFQGYFKSFSTNVYYLIFKDLRLVFFVSIISMVYVIFFMIILVCWLAK